LDVVAVAVVGLVGGGGPVVLLGLGDLADEAGVRDVVGVLVPDRPGRDPVVEAVLEHLDAGVGDQRGVGVVVGREHDVGLEVTVDVGDDRVLGAGARGVAVAKQLLGLD